MCHRARKNTATLLPSDPSVPGDVLDTRPGSQGTEGRRVGDRIAGSVRPDRRRRWQDERSRMVRDRTRRAGACRRGPVRAVRHAPDGSARATLVRRTCDARGRGLYGVRAGRVARDDSGKQGDGLSARRQPCSGVPPVRRSLKRLIAEHDSASFSNYAAFFGFFAVVTAATFKLVELGAVIVNAGTQLKTLLATAGL